MAMVCKGELSNSAPKMKMVFEDEKGDQVIRKYLNSDETVKIEK